MKIGTLNNFCAKGSITIFNNKRSSGSRDLSRAVKNRMNIAVKRTQANIWSRIWLGNLISEAEKGLDEDEKKKNAFGMPVRPDMRNLC
jgi:hypothetical protein